MNGHDSTVGLVHRIRAGDEQAAGELWDKFFPQLLRVARRRLKGRRRQVADEEDVVLSALNSFFRAVREGRFAELKHRRDLWRLLAAITRRKAVDLIRFNARCKRSVSGESALGKLPSDDHVSLFDERPAPAPDFDLATDYSEGHSDLLDQLNPDLRELALLKLRGYTHQEIARYIERSVATVERRFRLIRDIWCEMLKS